MSKLARRALALRTVGFTESVIREMTRLNARHGGINLAQGFPDFAAPAEIKEAAKRAIDADVNQYAITWGAPSLRRALAAAYRELYDLDVDPETMLTVTCGATEAMISTLLAVVDPGDEVVVLEPFYENYGPDTAICGAVPVYVPLRPPAAAPEGTGEAGAEKNEGTFDPAELRRAFTSRTKAIIVNTPNNPTGRVLRRAELEVIAELCREHDAIAITDEIYEHIRYGRAREDSGSEAHADARASQGERSEPGGELYPHIPIATLPGMAERTVTISGASKTFSVTGWRVGWIVAPPELTAGIRKVHDFVTVGAPAPLQEAVAVALGMGPSYRAKLADEYRRRRDILYGALVEAGFSPRLPEGAYYVLCDISRFGFADDSAFARWLVREVGVAGVPGSSFYSRPELGRHLIRFTFCKTEALLREAGTRLLRTEELAAAAR